MAEPPVVRDAEDRHGRPASQPAHGGPRRSAGHATGSSVPSSPAVALTHTTRWPASAAGGHQPAGEVGLVVGVGPHRQDRAEVARSEERRSWPERGARALLGSLPDLAGRVRTQWPDGGPSRRGAAGPDHDRRRRGRPCRSRVLPQRTVLARLALSAPEAVADAALVDALWPGGAPDNATGNLQSYVSRLAPPGRRRRGRARTGGLPARRRTRTRSTSSASRPWSKARRRRDRPAAAAAGFAAALALWRGEPFADLSDPFAFAPDRARLVALHRRASRAGCRPGSTSVEAVTVLPDLERAAARRPRRRGPAPPADAGAAPAAAHARGPAGRRRPAAADDRAVRPRTQRGGRRPGAAHPRRRPGARAPVRHRRSDGSRRRPHPSRSRSLGADPVGAGGPLRRPGRRGRRRRRRAA